MSDLKFTSWFHGPNVLEYLKKGGNYGNLENPRQVWIAKFQQLGWKLEDLFQRRNPVKRIGRKAKVWVSGFHARKKPVPE